MIRRPPRSTRTDTLFPYPTLCRSALHRYMSIVAAGLIFLCTPTLVADGDGPVWCAEGPRIRIAGIAARELDGTCRRGHPCPRAGPIAARNALVERSEEHTSELQSLMRISYAVFCLKKKNNNE